MQADTCLLQEMHTSKSDLQTLMTSQFNHVFAANVN